MARSHRAFACRQRPGYLVGEVHVSWGVNQVEHVVTAVGATPRQPDRLALDRDAALALDVHPVQVLRPHLPVAYHPGELQHPVSERRLAVVDVGDDAEVPDYCLIGPRRLRQRSGPCGRGLGARRRGRWPSGRVGHRWHSHPLGEGCDHPRAGNQVPQAGPHSQKPGDKEGAGQHFAVAVYGRTPAAVPTPAPDPTTRPGGARTP